MSDDEKTCPDCAEVIKRDAKVCRHCGKRFSKSELMTGTSDTEIDEAILKAQPHLSVQMGGPPILYEWGRLGKPVPKMLLEKVATQSNFSFEQVRDRFLALGWTFEGDDSADNDTSRTRSGQGRRGAPDDPSRASGRAERRSPRNDRSKGEDVAATVDRVAAQRRSQILTPTVQPYQGFLNSIVRGWALLILLFVVVALLTVIF